MAQQVFTGVTKDAPSTSVNNYIGVASSYVDGFAWNTNVANRYLIMPVSGRITNLHVWLDTSPGSGKSYNFSIIKNGTAGNPQVTISNAATSGSDNSNSISVSAGDRVAIRCAPTSTPNALGKVQWAVTLTTDTPAKFVTGSNSSYGGMSASAVRYIPITATGLFYSTLIDAQQVCPLDGTIREFFAEMNTAPGSGKAWTFSIYKNGVEEATSLMDVVDSNVSISLTGLSIDIQPGDLLNVAITPSGTPTLPTNMGISLGIDADTPGESMIASWYSDGVDGSATEYNAIGNHYSKNWSGTEADFKQKCGAIGFTLRNYFVYGYNAGSVAPGSYSMVVMKNGSPTSLGITYNRASAGTSSDTSNSASFASGDEVDYRITPSSPNWGGFSTKMSLVQYIAPKTGTYSENPTFTDTFIRQGRKVLSETATITATMLRTTTRILSETVTYADTLLKMATKVLSEAITYVDSVTKIKILSKVVSDSVTFTDSIIRLIGKVLSESFTNTDTPTVSGGGGSSVFKIKTGTYTGNGSDNRAITGIGFQPTLVWIKPKDTTANNGAMSWDALGSDKSFDPTGSSTPSANMIQSFDVDGFTIGTEANVNTSGVDYVWVAMTGADSYVKTGSYVGNGTSSNIVSGVGFQPDFIIIKRNGSSQGGYYWSLGNYRYTWTSNNGASGFIIDNSDGFEVLSSSSVLNSNGKTYDYFCLKLDAAWGKMDSYTGNATDNNAKTGVGFSPDFVWIKSTSASKPAAFRTRDGHSGDSTTTWIASTADAADLIQSLDADGFTLGTSDVVNASTSYRYLALRSAPSSASYNTTLTETVTLADTFIRNAMRVLSESVTYIDVVLKTASRTLSEVVTYIDSVQTNLTSLKTKVLSEVVTFTDTIIRTLTRVLSESVTYIATFNTAYNVVISNSVTYVDTVLKRAGKTITEAFSPIDTLIRSLTRILSESVTYTDIFASIKMRVITITNSFTLTDTLTKLVLKVILAVENVQFIDILKVYLNGVLGRWVQKFSSRGTSYNDKNAKRNTVYSDKYSKGNTDRWNNKYF